MTGVECSTRLSINSLQSKLAQTQLVFMQMFTQDPGLQTSPSAHYRQHQCRCQRYPQDVNHKINLEMLICHSVHLGRDVAVSDVADDELNLPLTLLPDDEKDPALHVHNSRQ